MTNKVHLVNFLVCHESLAKKFNSNDLYHLSFSVLVEMFIRILRRENAVGIIVAEARRPFLDERLLEHWRLLQKRGTANFSGAEVKKYIEDFSLYTKRDNVASIELADLVVNPIGSQLLHGLDLPHWRIIESKLYGGGSSLDSGIVHLPQSSDFLNRI